MLALLQRVTYATVKVNQEIIGHIDHGILALIAIEPNDTTQQADRLMERILGYRIFSDEQGRMNLSLKDVNGGLLLVSQFTLAANTNKGMRPSFTKAAPSELGKELFDYLVKRGSMQHSPIATGQFGAYMQISLCNDGPATFLLKT